MGFRLGMLALGSIALVPLTGCVSAGNHPNLDGPGGASSAKVRDVVAHVTCELRAADVGGKLRKGKYQVSVQLTLLVEDNIQAGPLLSYSEPGDVKDTSFDATIAGELGRGRKRSFTTSYVLDAATLDKIVPAECPGENPDHGGLRGDLGIAEIVVDGFAAAEAAAVLPPPPPLPGAPLADQPALTPSFSSTVEFVITKSLSKGGIGWTLTRYTVLGGDGSLASSKNVRTDTIVIAFAPEKPPAPSQITLILIEISKAKELAYQKARFQLEQDKVAFMEFDNSGPKSLIEQKLYEARRAEIARQSDIVNNLKIQSDAAKADVDTAADTDAQKVDETARAEAVERSKALITNELLQNLKTYR